MAAVAAIEDKRASFGDARGRSSRRVEYRLIVEAASDGTGSGAGEKKDGFGSSVEGGEVHGRRRLKKKIIVKRRSAKRSHPSRQKDIQELNDLARAQHPDNRHHPPTEWTAEKFFETFHEGDSPFVEQARRISTDHDFLPTIEGMTQLLHDVSNQHAADSRRGSAGLSSEMRLNNSESLWKKATDASPLLKWLVTPGPDESVREAARSSTVSSEDDRVRQEDACPAQA